MQRLEVSGAVRPLQWSLGVKGLIKHRTMTHGGEVWILCGSDNLIPKLPNTVYSCGQHGPVTVWLWSARPGNDTCYKNMSFFGSRSTLSIAMALLLLRLCFTGISFCRKLSRFEEIAEPREGTRLCFWNEKTSGVACAALHLPQFQRVSSPSPRYKGSVGSLYLTKTV
jgi:hypothetical protein